MALNQIVSNVPGIYVNLIPPVPVLNGVPTNIIGFVGSASYGPINSPTPCGGLSNYLNQFGTPKAIKYDMGTQVYAASLQGATNFMCVRVTDGTDTSAKAILYDTSSPTPISGLVAIALYTGSAGNDIFINIQPGNGNTSANPLYKITIYFEGGVPEVFDSIGGAGNQFWVNAVHAINFGQSPLRGPSKIAVASLGSAVNPPNVITYGFDGGTDGSSGITYSMLIGTDGFSTRSGMYALRSSGASVVVIADLDTTSTYTTQAIYGQGEGSYMVGTLAAGFEDNIAGAITAKQASGIDSYAFKLMMGDWVLLNDVFNEQQRYVSPQGYVAGILATQPPYLPCLNKIMYGVVATQKSSENRVYSDYDLSNIATAGMEVITNPIPASVSAFGGRIGINTSSNLLAQNDTYTRMNNYLALTIQKGMGLFIGQAYSTTTVQQVQNTISAFLQTLQQQGWIGVLTPSPNSPPPPAFNVVMDTSQQATGVLIANVSVRLFSIVTQIIVNLNANSGVQTVQFLAPQLIAA